MTSALEVWLYGSHARGIADEQSDTDVLLVTDDATAAPPQDLLAPFRRVTVSRYLWHEVFTMHSYGSLFLDHIRQEGVRLDGSRNDSRLQGILDTLPKFTRATHDLNGFKFAASEARRSLANYGWPDLELNVMAAVARHAAILGCYCSGQPDYGRESPFHRIGLHLGYCATHRRRLASLATRYRYLELGDEAWLTEADQGIDWLSDVEQLLEDLEPVIRGYEVALRAATSRPSRVS
jgi:hypothetical protein